MQTHARAVVYRPGLSCGPSTTLAPLTPSTDVPHDLLDSAQRAQCLVGCVSHESFESAPNGLRVCLRAAGQLRGFEEWRINMQCLLHTNRFVASIHLDNSFEGVPEVRRKARRTREKYGLRSLDGDAGFPTLDRVCLSLGRIRS